MLQFTHTLKQGLLTKEAYAFERRIVLDTKASMYSKAGRTHGWIQSIENIPPKPEQMEVPTEPEFTPFSETPAAPVADFPNMATPDELYTCPVMAHTSMQKWQEIYEPEQGFDRGTIFAELDLPFIGEGACKHE